MTAPFPPGNPSSQHSAKGRLAAAPARGGPDRSHLRPAGLGTIIPAASARTTMIPHPDPDGRRTHPLHPAPWQRRVVPGGGMAGWQITLIALGAALVAATAAVPLDRARAARRSAPATLT